ncbi:hypothetical protein ACGRHY_03020 [Streptomyces sp. HK10]|uniref:hypothetical protein n=1 Tax=Streptomyces sp. HK10 TaxID=3373255 RepID=UPI0037480929
MRTAPRTGPPWAPMARLAGRRALAAVPVLAGARAGAVACHHAHRHTPENDDA